MFASDNSWSYVLIMLTVIYITTVATLVLLSKIGLISLDKIDDGW